MPPIAVHLYKKPADHFPRIFQAEPPDQKFERRIQPARLPEADPMGKALGFECRR